MTYFECVFVVSVIQHAMCMRHIVMCGLPRSTKFFHIISWKGKILEKELLNTKYVFWLTLQLLSETFLILRIAERDFIKFYTVLHVKYLLFLSDINETWIFSTCFWKVLIYQITWKSVQWEPSCSIRTGTTKLIVASRNFEKAPKSWSWVCVRCLILCWTRLCRNISCSTNMCDVNQTLHSTNSSRCDWRKMLSVRGVRISWYYFPLLDLIVYMWLICIHTSTLCIRHVMAWRYQSPHSWLRY
jgi:hypothetical protein